MCADVSVLFLYRCQSVGARFLRFCRIKSVAEIIPGSWNVKGHLLGASLLLRPRRTAGASLNTTEQSERVEENLSSKRQNRDFPYYNGVGILEKGSVKQARGTWVYRLVADYSLHCGCDLRDVRRVSRPKRSPKGDTAPRIARRPRM